MKFKLIRLIIMFSKYALLGVVTQLFTYTFLLATDGNAQQNLSVHEVTIDLNLREATLEEVFEAIENKTDYNFLYDKRLLRNTSNVSIIHKNATVGEILMEISKKQHLKFKQINETINVNKKDKADTDNVQVEVMQTMTVTGQVLSGEDNSSLPGANVLIKGTAQGTVTDIEGMYSLEVPAENTILV
ncbi:MAG: carboxypeptidase-like regulatory domain-containing protein, partial [Cyclobacteriaceae bacterium]|nr:carboxypeptidase-like regulatory domain-containing protein [Cyclobacteriaceae bacterium]